MSDYHINVFYSDEDGAPAEALAEVAKAKGAWLAAAREAGKPVPAPRYRPATYVK